MDRRKLVIAVGALVLLAGGGVAWAATSSDNTSADGASVDGAGQRPRAGATPESTGSPVPVIVPGRPGESASVVPSDQLAAPDGTRYNSYDVWFVQMMIPHHRQAVELAALAPGRSRDPQLRAIAERISVAQGPEIAVLEAWLSARGLDPTGAGRGAHDHGAMRGMQSPGEVAVLRAATGDAFDAMFVEMMSEHHRGAIDMCTDVLRTGADERLQELATNIAGEQQIEIGRMRDALAG